MVRHVLLLALAGCGRLGFDTVEPSGSDAAGGADTPGGLQPIHLYELDGSYADTFGGPSLVGAGGTFVPAGYQFDANQGLRVDGALPASIYSVDIQFSFTDVSDWRKILDYEGLANDTGLYIYRGAVQFVLAAGADFLCGAATITPSLLVRVTLTRDATGHVVGYLGRAPIAADRGAGATPPSAPTGMFAFDDTSPVAVLKGTRATFFIDDAVTFPTEAAPGTVRRIAIYDVALTAAQVAALP
jgi:hypothetical protein